MQVPIYASSSYAYRVQLSDRHILIDPDLSTDLHIMKVSCILLTGSSPEHHTFEYLEQLLDRYPAAAIIAPEAISASVTSLKPARTGLHNISHGQVSVDESTVIYGIVDTSASGKRSGFVIHRPQGSTYIAGWVSRPGSALVNQLKVHAPVHTVILPVAPNNRLIDDPVVEEGFSAYEAAAIAETVSAQQLVVITGSDISADEIRLVHRRLLCSASLLVNPRQFFVGRPKASVIVRTLNEERYLEPLLKGILEQQTEQLDYEVILVDSGSTDQTVAIAEKYGCKILHITRESFSFGRSLNMGCEAASGDLLVITSGHCVPASPHWLQQLCQPLLNGAAQYSYGKQVGGPFSKFSECRVFEKYFPNDSQIPQQGFYCNNANSALLKSAWSRYRFDEELTGLEDMELAQRLVRDGGKVAYVAEAPVYHHHNETWLQVRRRFEREAIALQKIMPHVHVGWFDAVRYTLSSVWRDTLRARKAGVLRQKFIDILRYRYHQYMGSYRGNHEHRKLSRAEKDQYFYPH